MAQQDMQNLMQNWVEQQQKLWQNWAQSVQKATGGGRVAQAWTPQGLDQWQKAVDQTLDTQKKAIRAWADQVAATEGAPEEMKRLASEGVKVIEQWTDAQHTMWQQWFALMHPAGSGGAEDHVEQLASGWQQMASQMQDLQRQWAGALSGMTEADKPKGGGKSGASKTT